MRNEQKGVINWFISRKLAETVWRFSRFFQLINCENIVVIFKSLGDVMLQIAISLGQVVQVDLKQVIANILWEIYCSTY